MITSLFVEQHVLVKIKPTFLEISMSIYTQDFLCYALALLGNTFQITRRNTNFVTSTLG
jgi:hypothetical protein